MNLFSELKRRNIFKVAAAYLALAWVTLQIADIVIPALGLPDMIITAVVVIGIIGLPFALFFAWAYELTPEGMKRTEEVELEKSIRATTGQKINYIIIGLLSVAVIFLLFDRNADSRIEASDKTIAVMPFEDMSADGSQAYFGDGIAEEILNVLVTIDELDVTSRTSSFSLKDEDLLVSDIAERLNVNYILEGSIRTDGENVRVTAQLIDVAADRHLWSDTYDRELTSIFEIQDEVAREVAQALRIELVGAEPLKNVATQNMEAYDLYLQARQLFLTRSNGSRLNEALDLYTRATHLDPTFADAWADLAAIYSIIGTYGSTVTLTGNEDYLAKMSSDHALTINPDLSQAWAAKGNVYLKNDQYQDSLFAFDRAIRLNPQNETAWKFRATLLSFMGHHEEALKSIQRSLELAPDPSASQITLARALAVAGDGETASLILQNTSVQLTRAEMLAVIGIVNHDREKIKQGILLINNAIFGVDDGNAEEVVDIILDGYFMPERREEIYNSGVTDENAGNFVLNSVAQFFLGSSDDFLTFIKTLPDSTNFDITFYWYMLKPLRAKLNDPAVKEYYKEIGVTDFWEINGFPSFCRAVGEDDFECQDAQGNWP